MLAQQAGYLIFSRAPRRDAGSGGQSLSRCITGFERAQRAAVGLVSRLPATPGSSQRFGAWLGRNPMEAMEGHAGQIIRAPRR